MATESTSQYGGKMEAQEKETLECTYWKMFGIAFNNNTSYLTAFLEKNVFQLKALEKYN